MVCRKPEKIIDREFVNNFSNHVPPPPRGKKKFIASDCVYKVLSRNYWAKKKNEPKSNSQTGWIAVNIYVPFGPWTNSPPWSKKTISLNTHSFMN